MFLEPLWWIWCCPALKSLFDLFVLAFVGSQLDFEPEPSCFGSADWSGWTLCPPIQLGLKSHYWQGVSGCLMVVLSFHPVRVVGKIFPPHSCYTLLRRCPSYSDNAFHMNLFILTFISHQLSTWGKLVDVGIRGELLDKQFAVVIIHIKVQEVRVFPSFLVCKFCRLSCRGKYLVWRFAAFPFLSPQMPVQLRSENRLPSQYPRSLFAASTNCSHCIKGKIRRWTILSLPHLNSLVLWLLPLVFSVSASIFFCPSVCVSK